MKLLLVLLSTVFLLDFSGQISYALPKASADEADPAGEEAKVEDGAVEPPVDAADEGEAPAGEAVDEAADGEEEEPAAEGEEPAEEEETSAEGEEPAEEDPQDYVSEVPDGSRRRH